MKKLIPILGLLVSACGGGSQQAEPQPPEVGVMAVRTETVDLQAELPGRTSAYETSDVRPQVNGLILRRLFEEGDNVRAGQALYKIDPAPYEAQVASARAALAQAKSQIAASEAQARRYGELVKINAISKQEAENAEAAAAQARATVQAQEAALRSAQIDLARTTVRAPISGRIGRSTYTTGALVSASQAEPLTTIQHLDPIYVDIQQSSADVLRLRQEILAGKLAGNGSAAQVNLTLEDGSTYPAEGRLKFTDVTVDPSTGSQVIRAVFPNKQGLLLPGMYVRASFVEGTKADGLLVPQRAVQRDEKGQPVVLVVGKDGKVSQRVIETDRTAGTNWLVTGGLKEGEKIVVSGQQNARPGATVTPQLMKPGEVGDRSGKEVEAPSTEAENPSEGR
ncbi:efflux RND transporter periplasmic adaptor subunit [Novosphingobium mangrovi (ex Hu et al. 2023)]|uniref:Efflux RND transporter periplasmic adaptor subunit n=1 Tax=Novosphingobium mangrovi (ex Hu et al. 2023) TaxID=2930094 RepID=A0ABT0A7U7_9SPHN|nr:efflux RND transporter periplasmic adaptor subunit [Novosphingobium mangrovi (ex Hu et al. 2023)]MCJ1959275.1 efflux RND transporter periplasmic adaptor subunit [Novosphingobium mangrovi (ex Hu et al. 2023)]